MSRLEFIHGHPVKRYLLEQMRSLMQLDDPPHRLALAFAWGTFIAFSPTIGLHLITCLAVAWAFRLSKLVIIIASSINNPWTIVPLYGFCIWFGVKITGTDIPGADIAWKELTLSSAYQILKPYLWPYIAGTLIVGTIAAFVSYFLFYWIVVRYRQQEIS